VGGDPAIFPESAAATLARFTGGVPRTVGQLAQLALAAAAGDGLDKVDSATVERAWRELAAAGVVHQPRHDAQRSEADEDLSSPAPRVRVVRRLWGG
jgi:hypothetical protein